jgi:hypothetical protein
MLGFGKPWQGQLCRKTMHCLLLLALYSETCCSSNGSCFQPAGLARQLSLLRGVAYDPVALGFVPWMASCSQQQVLELLRHSSKQLRA